MTLKCKSFPIAWLDHLPIDRIFLQIDLSQNTTDSFLMLISNFEPNFKPNDVCPLIKLLRHRMHAIDQQFNDCRDVVSLCPGW